MKKVLLACFFACFMLVAFAQKTKFEARIGTNLSTLTGDEDEGVNSKVGLLVGGTFHFKILDWLYFQPSLLLTEKGAVEKVLINSEKIKTKVDAWYGEIPVHVSFRFPLGNDFSVRLNGGVYYSYGLMGKTSLEVGDYSHSVNTFEKEYADGEKYRPLITQDIGLSFETVVQYKQVTLGLGLDRGMTPVNDDLTWDDLYNVSGSIILGYRF